MVAFSWFVTTALVLLSLASEATGQGNNCTCPNGTAVLSQFCATDGATNCSTCDSFFSKVQNECIVNTCICPNGVASGGVTSGPTDGQKCATNGTVDCISCNTNFILSAVDGPGAGPQSCVANNTCSCPNGTASTARGAEGTLCEVDKAEDCQACDIGYGTKDIPALGNQTCAQCGQAGVESGTCYYPEGDRTVTTNIFIFAGQSFFKGHHTFTVDMAGGVEFRSGSNTTFGNQTTYKTTGAGSVVFLPNSVVIVLANAWAKFMLPVTFMSTQITNNGELQFQSPNVLLDSTTIEGTGTIVFSVPAAMITFKKGSNKGTLAVVGRPNAQRRNLVAEGLTVVNMCGNSQNLVTLNGTAALQINSNPNDGCTASSVTTLDTTTGGFIQVIGISAASAASTITTWTGVRQKIIVANPNGASSGKVFLTYGPAAALADCVAASVEPPCALSTCSAVPEFDPNTGTCNYLFTQILPPAGNESSSGLYALFALFALLVPIALCAGLAWWYLREPEVKDVAPQYMNYVQQPGQYMPAQYMQPTPTPTYIPAPSALPTGYVPAPYVAGAR